MLTKGAIGNLINRYRAVLKKCNLINTFGSLAVASMLVLGGAGMAMAGDVTGPITGNISKSYSDATKITSDQITVQGYGSITASGDLTVESTTNNAVQSEGGLLTITSTAGSLLFDASNAAGNNGNAIQAQSDMTVTAAKDLTLLGNNRPLRVTNGAVVTLKAAAIYMNTNASGTTSTMADNSVLKATGNSSVTLTADKIVINAVNNGDSTSSNPNKNAHGIWAEDSSVTINGETTITANTEHGRADGIHLANSNITVNGPLNITTKGVAVASDYNFATQGIYLAYSQATFNDDVTIETNATGTDAVNIGLRVLGDTNSPVSEAVFKKNLTLTANSTGSAIGIQSSGSEDGGVLVIGDSATITVEAQKDATGILAQYNSSISSSESSSVKISAKSETGDAIAIHNAYNPDNKKAAKEIKLLGDVELVAEGDEEAKSYAIYNDTSATDEAGNTYVGGEGKKVAITGDIFAEGGLIETTLGTADSHLTGAVTTQGNATTTLNMAEGSNWNVTADSSVSNLGLNGGNVNVPTKVAVNADNTTGSGTINMQALDDAGTALGDGDLGSFTAGAESTASLTVQATDANGSVLNADQVAGTDILEKVQAKVTKDSSGNTSGETFATAYAPEGDVNGAITLAKDGTPTMARNGLMDDMLRMATANPVSLDRILTNDVRKRLGDIRSDANKTGVWMRWDGGKLQGDGLTNNFNTIQIGGDTKVAKNCRLGVAGSFTHGDTDFARGNGEVEGFSFAAYATWMGDNGMFADIVARIGHFSTDVNVEGRSGDMDNSMASLSGEYGWRFNICDQFFIEPQIELAYTYVSTDDLQLGATKYSFDSDDSLTGRAGIVAGWNLPDDMGNVYARVSVLQQFMGDAKVTGVNGSVRNIQKIDGDDTWVEYGIGANVKLTDNTYIWADVERTEGAKIDEEWRGTVGFRFSF